MRFFLYIIVAIVTIAVDQISKWLIVVKLNETEVHPVIGDFFAITSHRNKGAAFGILQNQRTFFVIITIIILVGLIWYLLKTIRESNQKLLPFALSLLLGGAIGNFIDRVINGEVVDFLQFHFKFNIGFQVDYIFPIFNFADSAIVIGVALIILDSLLQLRSDKKKINNEVEVEHNES